MPNPILPLQLCQVLEEEVLHLHGITDDPPPSWDFQPEHFPDPAALAHKFATLRPPLAEFLNLALGTIATDAKSLTGQFNELLAHTKLYHPEYFPFESLSDELQELVKLKEGSKDGFDDDGVRYFNRRLLEHAFSGCIVDICNWRLHRIIAHIHAQDKETAALCLSGGGIRSATFSLGVLQGLARHDLLKRFDYLSTVSGGGYIGSWLSTWINRHKDGLQGVTHDLAREVHEKQISPEAAPLQYLREYSNFLTPRFNILSADVWSFIAIYIRNLVINWLVLIPLLMAALGIPHIGMAVVQTPDVNSPWQWSLLIFGLICIGISVAFASGNRPSINATPDTAARFWRQHADQRNFLLYCLLPLILAAMSLGAFWAWWQQPGKDVAQQLSALLPQFLPLRDDLSWLPFAIFGFAGYLLGWLIYSNLLRRYKAWEVGVIFLTGPIGGWLLWLLATKVLPLPGSFGAKDSLRSQLYTSFVVPGFLFVFFLSVTLFVGLSSRARRMKGERLTFLMSEDDREWFARFGGWMLIVIVCWSVFTPVILLAPTTLQKIHGYLASVGGISGLLSAWLGNSSFTSANQEKSTQSSLKSILLEHALSIFSFVFLLFLAMELSLLFTHLVDWGLRLEILPTTFGWARMVTVLVVILALTLLGLVMAKLVNLNMFSLHAGYRSRLVRAFLGASRMERMPNPFTGFDPQDNVRVHELQKQRPLHVINTALNLVRGEKLAWQQRKAESFIFTPLHSGSLFVGFRHTHEYGGDEGVSLGTVATISGAAANSNMGYHTTSALVTFVLTLFNVRLGWWLGNPGLAGSYEAALTGQSYYQLGFPNSAIYPIFAEAFGLTDDRNSYVLLSDGGHFENLGLYEMVLRRRKTIVVVDAGQDEKGQFEDLGNAMRKIRIDLGIPISFDSIAIYPRDRATKGHYCAMGKIEYSCVDGTGVAPGRLIYIKPAFYGDEPSDIYNYAQANPAFPHEPTLDQFFDEPQFESYRMLGSYIMNVICGSEWGSLSLDQFADRAEKHINPKPPPTPEEWD